MIPAATGVRVEVKAPHPFCPVEINKVKPLIEEGELANKLMVGIFTTCVMVPVTEEVTVPKSPARNWVVLPRQPTGALVGLKTPSGTVSAVLRSPELRIWKE